MSDYQEFPTFIQFNSHCLQRLNKITGAPPRDEEFTRFLRNRGYIFRLYTDPLSHHQIEQFRNHNDKSIRDFYILELSKEELQRCLKFLRGAPIIIEHRMTDGDPLQSSVFGKVLDAAQCARTGSVYVLVQPQNHVHGRYMVKLIEYIGMNGISLHHAINDQHGVSIREASICWKGKRMNTDLISVVQVPEGIYPEPNKDIEPYVLQDVFFTTNTLSMAASASSSNGNPLSHDLLQTLSTKEKINRIQKNLSFSKLIDCFENGPHQMRQLGQTIQPCKKQNTSSFFCVTLSSLSLPTKSISKNDRKHSSSSSSSSYATPSLLHLPRKEETKFFFRQPSLSTKSISKNNRNPSSFSSYSTPSLLHLPRQEETKFFFRQPSSPLFFHSITASSSQKKSVNTQSPYLHTQSSSPGQPSSGLMNGTIDDPSQKVNMNATHDTNSYNNNNNNKRKTVHWSDNPTHTSMSSAHSVTSHDLHGNGTNNVGTVGQSEELNGRGIHDKKLKKEDTLQGSDSSTPLGLPHTNGIPVDGTPKDSLAPSTTGVLPTTTTNLNPSGPIPSLASNPGSTDNQQQSSANTNNNSPPGGNESKISKHLREIGEEADAIHKKMLDANVDENIRQQFDEVFEKSLQAAARLVEETEDKSRQIRERDQEIGLNDQEIKEAADKIVTTLQSTVPPHIIQNRATSALEQTLSFLSGKKRISSPSPSPVLRPSSSSSLGYSNDFRTASSTVDNSGMDDRTITREDKAYLSMLSNLLCNSLMESKQPQRQVQEDSVMQSQRASSSSENVDSKGTIPLTNQRVPLTRRFQNTLQSRTASLSRTAQQMLNIDPYSNHLIQSQKPKLSGMYSSNPVINPPSSAMNPPTQIQHGKFSAYNNQRVEGNGVQDPLISDPLSEFQDISKFRSSRRQTLH